MKTIGYIDEGWNPEGRPSVRLSKHSANAKMRSMKQ